MKRLVCALACVLLVAALGAQELAVRSSSGIAEIEIAGSWLQAVSGRTVPAGATVATWREAALEIGGARITAMLDELSLLRVDEVSAEEEAPLRLELIAGRISLSVEGRAVELVAGEATLALAEGRLVVADGEVELFAGSVALSYDAGGRRLVDAPARFTLADYGAEPILAP